MPTHEFTPGSNIHIGGSSAPEPVEISGTNFPIPALAFDAASIEECFLFFTAQGYTSGNLTVDVFWEAPTSTTTTHTVRWGASLAAITFNTDTGAIDAKAFATEATVDDDILGTTAQRGHKATVTITATDSIADGDWCCLRIRRVANHANDDLTEDARLVHVDVSYS